MMRYIKQLVLRIWYRLFKSEDEREELKLVYAFNNWCMMARGDAGYPVNSEVLFKLAASLEKLRHYITQIKNTPKKERSFPPIAETICAICGPDIPSIKLRMHYFLLMCLDDV